MFGVSGEPSPSNGKTDRQIHTHTRTHTHTQYCCTVRRNIVPSYVTNQVTFSNLSSISYCIVCAALYSIIPVCFSTCLTPLMVYCTTYLPVNADTPEQPVNVTVTEVTPFSVALAWVEPHDNNAPINDYIITIDSRGTDPTEVRANASVEAFNVTGLHPFVNYSLTVAAENDEGVGLMSIPVVQQTLEFCE